jgi:death-on-curing protein
MSFLLLSVDHIIAIHDEVLELNELQGMAGHKSLEGVLSRVDNRLKYGLMDDIYSLAAQLAMQRLFLSLIALMTAINEQHFR